MEEQERAIEEEEEAFYEAKREAARIARLTREKESATKARVEKEPWDGPSKTTNHNDNWADEDEWEM